MSDDNEHPEGLTRTGVHRVLRSELGEKWRFFRWVSRQFTPTSLAVIGAIATFAGGWITKLSNKVDVQGERIVVLETKVVPGLEATNTFRDRLSSIEVDIATLKGAVGSFNFNEAQREAGKETLHGQPYSKARHGEQK